MTSIEEIIHSMKRNPFFLPSGFYPQEAINIVEAGKENRERRGKIRERKRAEKKLHKRRLYATKPRHPKNHAERLHIQKGFDLAKEWGWDGINKTYHPNLMKV